MIVEILDWFVSFIVVLEEFLYYKKVQFTRDYTG